MRFKTQIFEYLIFFPRSNQTFISHSLRGLQNVVEIEIKFSIIIRTRASFIIYNEYLYSNIIIKF
jgi:hypothetical protein